MTVDIFNITWKQWALMIHIIRSQYIVIETYQHMIVSHNTIIKIPMNWPTFFSIFPAYNNQVYFVYWPENESSIFVIFSNMYNHICDSSHRHLFACDSYYHEDYCIDNKFMFFISSIKIHQSLFQCCNLRFST